MTKADRRHAPFFLTWRETLGLTPADFWPRYGVAPGAGIRFERSIRGMPRVLMLLITLHRIGRIDEADLAWLDEAPAAIVAGLGRHFLDLRTGLGLIQTVFWPRFGISHPAGGRFERGRNIPPATRRLLVLYRAGRVNDEDLAEGLRWLAEQPLPDPDAGVDAVSEADARPDDLYAIRWMTSPHEQGEPGYLVTLTRRLQQHTCWFGLNRYGTALKALAAAQRWRDDLIAHHAPISKRDYVSMVRRNNTSGAAGVQRVDRVFTSASGTQTRYVAWTARPPRCLKVSGRSFRVDVYGEEGARERAVALRRQFEAQVTGFRAPHVPKAFLPDEEGADDGVLTGEDRDLTGVSR